MCGGGDVPRGGGQEIKGKLFLPTTVIIIAIIIVIII